MIFQVPLHQHWRHWQKVCWWWGRETGNKIGNVTRQQHLCRKWTGCCFPSPDRSNIFFYFVVGFPNRKKLTKGSSQDTRKIRWWWLLQGVKGEVLVWKTENRWRVEADNNSLREESRIQFEQIRKKLSTPWLDLSLHELSNSRNTHLGLSIVHLWCFHANESTPNWQQELELQRHTVVGSNGLARVSSSREHLQVCCENDNRRYSNSLSLFSPTKTEDLTVGSEKKKHGADPLGIKPGSYGC